MKIIAEIPLIGPDVLVDVPRDGKIVSLKIVGKVPTIFVLVDKLALTEPRRFVCFPTGADLPDGTTADNYVGSFTFTTEMPSMHVFECSVIALQG